MGSSPGEEEEENYKGQQSEDSRKSRADRTRWERVGYMYEMQVWMPHHHQHHNSPEQNNTITESRVVSGLLKISQRPLPSFVPPLTSGGGPSDKAERRSRGDSTDRNWRHEGPCRCSPELACWQDDAPEEQLIGVDGGRLPLAFCQIGDQSTQSSECGQLVGRPAGVGGTRAEMQVRGWRLGRLRDRDLGGDGDVGAPGPRSSLRIRPPITPSSRAVQGRGVLPLSAATPSVPFPTSNWLPMIDALETAAQSTGVSV